jgi:hypothetical protein
MIYELAATLGEWGSEEWQNVAAGATALGVILAAIGLLMQGRFARSSFEDELTREYRAIIRCIPTKAMLGGKLTNDERHDALKHFYHYFDLCNEQAYIKRKISRRTWRDWKEGIKGNVNEKREFELAWSYIASLAGKEEFKELRKLCPPKPYSSDEPYIS